MTLFLPTCAYILFAAEDVNGISQAIYVSTTIYGTVVTYVVLIMKRSELAKLLNHVQKLTNESKYDDGFTHHLVQNQDLC